MNIHLQRQCGGFNTREFGCLPGNCYAFVKVFCMVACKAISRVPMIKKGGGGIKSILKCM